MIHSDFLCQSLWKGIPNGKALNSKVRGIFHIIATVLKVVSILGYSWNPVAGSGSCPAVVVGISQVVVIAGAHMVQSVSPGRSNIISYRKSGKYGGIKIPESEGIGDTPAKVRQGASNNIPILRVDHAVPVQISENDIPRTHSLII